MAARQFVPGFAIFACAILGSDSNAQVVPPDTTLLRVLHEAASRAARVRITAGPTIEGRVLDYSTAGVRLMTGDSVAIQAIRQVELGSKEGSGALPGAVLGALILGPTISYFLLGTRSSGVGSVQIFGVSVAGIASGAMLGALAGATLKPARVVWRPVWTAGS